MKFQPTTTQRLYREIAEQIRAKIEAGEFPLGTRLPAERDLSEMLEVSRSSVREAIIALEINGFVDVRGGSGVYVTSLLPRASINVVAQADEVDIGPFELLEARLLVEPDCAALAAQNATADQRRALRNVHAAMQLVQPANEKSKGVGSAQYDRLLHGSIAEACGNAALASVCMHLWDLSERSPIFQRLDAHYVTQQDWTIAWGEHTRIVEAIVEGDAVRARHAMSYHLVAIMARLRENPAWTA